MNYNFNFVLHVIEIKTQKLWGGRFVEDVDPDFHNLNSSIHIDKRMYAEDIQVIFNIIDIGINFCNNLLIYINIYI